MKDSRKKNVSLLALTILFGVSTTTFAACTQKSSESPNIVVPGQPVDLTNAAEKAVNSVVYVQVKTKSKVTSVVESENPLFDFFGFGDFFGEGSKQRREYKTPEKNSAGSGVILSEDGYIVTNNHVVDGADELKVTLNDKRKFSARIIGQDAKTDLALIKIEAKNLPAITIRSSENVKIGEWVLAVGNPYNLTSTVTAGIVSAKARMLSSADEVTSFIQTDATINPGNSGGALVDTQGQLVGINTMIFSQTGSFSGYGFAIPTTIVSKIVNDLKKFGSVQRVVFGISGMDVSSYLDKNREEGNSIDLGTVTGVYVDKVVENSSAEEMGMKKGDVIIAVDGKKISQFSEFGEELTEHSPGDKVTITYLRDKKKISKSVTLKNAQGTTTVMKEIDMSDLGVALQPLSDELKQQLSLSYGLEVIALKNGPMQKAGIEKGIIIMQINDIQMKSKSDFEEAVKEANMSRERVLWIRAKTKSGLNKSYTVSLSNK